MGSESIENQSTLTPLIRPATSDQKPATIHPIDPTSDQRPETSDHSDHSRSRVRLYVDRLDALDARMGVDLRRRNGGVAEKLLHGAEVGAGVQQVRREGVAQRVHGEAGVFIDLAEKRGDGVLHGAHANAPAGAAQKERGAIDASPAAEHARELVAPGLVVPEREHGVVAHGDDALLASLAAQLHLLRYQVQVAAVDPGEFGEAHARGVEQLEHREIADVNEAPAPGADFRDLE